MLQIIILGCCFLCIMAAFQTSSFFQAAVLDDLGYKNLGFISLGLVYGLFALSTFIAPYIIFKFGARTCMMFGGLFYTLMLASLIYILEPLFLFASCLNGVGAALLWTGQGAAMVACSTPATQGRNAGIFWALLQLSLIAGSTTANFIIPNSDDTISRHTEQLLYIALTSICGVGVLGMLFLRIPPSKRRDQEAPTVFSCFFDTLNMCRNKTMLLLLPSIFYSGLLLSFWQAQYPDVVANKDVSLPSSFKPHQVAYLMLTVCAAEVSGSLVFGKLSDRIGRWPIVVAGTVFASTALLLIYLNLFQQLWRPHIGAAFAYGFLLGLADSVYNTQTFAALGVLFPEKGPDAFAANFFAKALASALAFYYSPYVPLQYQMLALGVLGAVTTVSFIAADRRTRPRPSDCEPLLIESQPNVQLDE